MSTLLYIQASCRYGRSYSIAVADAFVEAYLRLHSGDKVRRLDLFKKRLPAFDGPVVQAKYAILHGGKPDRAQKIVWAKIEEIIGEFSSADKYVMAVPMWNFGIPYRLKQYIDILVQPGYTFSYSPQKGFEGLMKGKELFVAYARGGDYSSPETAGFDFQRKYIETIFRFIGFTAIRSVVVEPTLQAGPETAQAKRTEAIETARKMAEDF